jgi:Tol biopolymer transport system component
MVYQTGFAQTDYIMQWAELESENASTVGTTGLVYHPRLSPDGSFAMVEVQGESEEGTDLWIVDLTSGLRTRFTFDMGDEYGPCWTPDGKFVIYTASTSETNRIMRQPVEGVGGAEILFESERQMRTTGVHPDGISLLFDQAGDGGDVDIFSLPLAGDGEPSAVLATPERQGGGRFSPDGRWIAYHATSAATWDVFVMPAAGGPRKWQVTTNGTVYPQWKADGSELLVSAFNGSVVAYEVDILGESFHVGSSRTVAMTESPSAAGVAYSIHPDGERILRAGPDPTSQAEISYIHLVTDWRRGLAQ